MAKNCLNKLGTNVTMSCSMPINGVKNIYLMHVEDVTVSLSSVGSWTAVNFATGAKSYKVEGYKQNIQVTTAIRSLDASNKLDISVMFKLPSSAKGADFNIVAPVLTRKFYVLVENNDLTYFVAGATCPLECSGLDWDSNANGQMITCTLTAPEGSAGNYFTIITPEARNTIISKAS